MVVSALPDGMLTINQVAEATGLTPSLLRIWESRYGWPTPRRLANGYRTYHPRQLDDIKRVAELVRTGRSIGTIIIDGLPSWPEDPARPPRRPKLEIARKLPTPRASDVIRLRDQLIDTIESERYGEAENLFQRLIWMIRPIEEATAVLLPTVVACAEVYAAGRPSPAGDRLLEGVIARCQQLMRGARTGAAAVRVAPSSTVPLDRAVAAVTIWLIASRGTGAELAPADPEALPAGGMAGWWLVAGEAAPQQAPDGLVHALPGDGRRTLADLLTGPLPWGR